MSSSPCRCVVCETDEATSKGGLCHPCRERYYHAQTDVALLLVTRFGLSRRTVNYALRLIEPRMFLVGGGTPEGRIIRWIEEARDSKLLCGGNIGPKRIAELRAAIPSRRSEWTLCHHCSGTGMIRGLDILA